MSSAYPFTIEVTNGIYKFLCCRFPSLKATPFAPGDFFEIDGAELWLLNRDYERIAIVGGIGDLAYCRFEEIKKRELMNEELKIKTGNSEITLVGKDNSLIIDNVSYTIAELRQFIAQHKRLQDFLKENESKLKER